MREKLYYITLNGYLKRHFSERTRKSFSSVSSAQFVFILFPALLCFLCAPVPSSSVYIFDKLLFSKVKLLDYCWTNFTIYFQATVLFLYTEKNRKKEILFILIGTICFWFDFGLGFVVVAKKILLIHYTKIMTKSHKAYGQNIRNGYNLLLAYDRSSLSMRSIIF
jgi:hypothetical protein